MGFSKSRGFSYPFLSSQASQPNGGFYHLPAVSIAACPGNRANGPKPVETQRGHMLKANEAREVQQHFPGLWPNLNTT